MLHTQDCAKVWGSCANRLKPFICQQIHNLKCKQIRAHEIISRFVLFVKIKFQFLHSYSVQCLQRLVVKHILHWKSLLNGEQGAIWDIELLLVCVTSVLFWLHLQHIKQTCMFSVYVIVQTFFIIRASNFWIWVLDQYLNWTYILILQWGVFFCFVFFKQSYLLLCKFFACAPAIHNKI